MESTVLNLLFYGFAFLAVFSALMVVLSRNSVHSVLFLIFTFFNAAGLMVLLGVEYIAMTLVIVYVGAVAVLFLFVVMMLDVDIDQWRHGFTKHLVAGLGVAVILFTQLAAVLYAGYVAKDIDKMTAPTVVTSEQVIHYSNAEHIGFVLYTDYAYVFLLASLVLLVAMIGAIVLTLRHQPNVKRQNITKQLARKRKDGVELVKVESSKGVTL
jgi:NADH-quinone oxidoreductase subunit J